MRPGSLIPELFTIFILFSPESAVVVKIEHTHIMHGSGRPKHQPDSCAIPPSIQLDFINFLQVQPCHM